MDGAAVEVWFCCLSRDQAFECFGEIAQIGQLGDTRTITLLTHTIDPHAAQAELGGGFEIMERTGADVDVAIAGCTAAFEEPLPVAMCGFV
jgi:hypothetical protein